MGVVKQFSINTRYRASSRDALRTTLPSDLVYTLGAAIFDRSNKSTRYSEKEFYRKAVNRLMQAVKNLRTLEDQYYG